MSSKALLRAMSPAARLAGISTLSLVRRATSFVDILAPADIVVDAILGTGFSGASVLLFPFGFPTLNEMDMMVVSADVPSGLNAETGEVEGPCVQATYTATMLAPKIGLYSGEGPEFAGDILCGELYDRLDEVIDDVEHAADIVEPADLIEYFPELPAHVNKYSRGSVLVVAGSSAYPGAAIMAAKAAAVRAPGYVTVATPDPCANLIRMALPSIPVVGIPADTRGAIRCRCRFGRTRSCGKIRLRPLWPWYDDCSRRYAGGYGASEKRRASSP